MHDIAHTHTPHIPTYTRIDIHTHLLDSLQHGASTLPGFGALADAAEASHAVPFPVLQLPVEGVGQQQHRVIDVAVCDLPTQQ